MRGGGETAGRDDQVGEGEDGPDGAEEEIVCFAGGPGAAVVVPA